MSGHANYISRQGIVCACNHRGSGTVADSEHLNWLHKGRSRNAVNIEHLNWLKEGVEAWNERRKDLDLKGIQPRLYGNHREANLQGADLSNASLQHSDFCGANLQGADLSGSDLYGANLIGANLVSANLIVAVLDGANLAKANLQEAKLFKASLVGATLRLAILRYADLAEANLQRANLSGADLRNADLKWANLIDAKLIETNLRESNLQGAQLIRSDLKGADLTAGRIHGIVAWDLRLDDHTRQANLIITPDHQPKVSVDSLGVAQFIYLLLTNAKLREVLDTLTTKTVLILGRFTPQRKAILDAIRDALRLRGYVPILFDFEGSQRRDLTETISTLAHLARFVVADLTDARSLPQELSHIVPFLPSVPVQPLILAEQREYGMFEHFARYPWVLPTFTYADQGVLLAALDEHVIAQAEAKVRELVVPKREVG